MDPLIRSLLRPDGYPHPVDQRGVQLAETHISWVLLTGPYAYKLKKPVNFGFVNFSTLELRKHFCEEELRLNRRLSNELYCGVQPVFGPRERASFNGDGEPIEYAVVMRQFPQEALLPAVLSREELTATHIDRLVRDLVQFQGTAAVASAEMPYGSPDAVRAPVLGNFAALEGTATDPTNATRYKSIADLRAWADAEFARLSERGFWEARQQAGRVRECHGDLHLGNMVLLRRMDSSCDEGGDLDSIHVFDCLEFNPGLRWIDVLSEMAFLVMDLQERTRRDFALRVLNRWLEATGDYPGLHGWRWYFVYRAMVRAKVAALRLRQADLAQDERHAKLAELTGYLRLAERWTGPRPRAIVITHGLSGSGKSVVSERLTEAVGMVRVRSDVERKRLFGESPEALYAPVTTDRLYDHLATRSVPAILAAGFPAVVDASFLQARHREQLRNLAAAEQLPFVLLDVRAPIDELRRRLVARQSARSDPSDATVAVMEHQLESREPLSDAELGIAIQVDTHHTDWWEKLSADLARREATLGAT